MRHRKAGRKLGRTASHRKALLANLAQALFEHKQIKTTTAKAKEAKRTVERLITFAKGGSVADRRQVLKVIRDKAIVKLLFDEIAPTYMDRKGGYTRVIKLGRRMGDGADMAILELVGYEGALIEKLKSREEEKSKKKKPKKETEAAE
ncbi:MAG: 50S ribosomal protein L17 [bacterium]